MDKLQKALPLSKEQTPALDVSDRNLLVSAGAGSGKTRVLIARFAYLILEGKASLNEILAITFTDKAANEMKNRLVELFTQLGREDLRRGVEEAFVSTMHSFASRLLKEYALEVGKDPEFQVLGEDERAVLETEVWEKLLEEEALELPIYPLLLEFKSKDLLKQELLSLRNKILSLGLNDPWMFSVPVEKLDGAKQEIIEQIQNAIQKLEEGSNLSKSEVKVLGGFHQAVNELQNGDCPRMGTVPILEASAKFTLTGKRDEFKELLTTTRERIKEALVLLEEVQTREKRENMMKLLELFHCRLEAEKKTRALLDYDDLLNTLLHFLRREDKVAQAIQSKLREKFQFIMMDELQDSNGVEKEILGRLSTGKNLFLVGDAKQSIYSFRQADVGIFLELEQQASVRDGNQSGEANSSHGVRSNQNPCERSPKAINLMKSNKVMDPRLRGDDKNDGRRATLRQAQGGEHSRTTDDVPQTKLLRLQDNYRSNPKILDFINGFFGEVIFKDSLINYQDLKVPQDGDSPHAGTVPITTPHNDKQDVSRFTQNASRVECWVAHDLESSVKKDIRQLWEADHIAERIVELKEEGASFGDVAILLKNFTDVSLYERSLRDRGIPYNVIAGRGFYQKTEVLDVVNFLTCIENPWDDIALTSVLRSPLVNLSDDGILFLAVTRNEKPKEPGQKNSLWGSIRAESFWKNLSPKDKKALRTFLDLQSEFQAKRSSMRTSKVIREIISTTSYDTKVLLEAGGKRKFANLEKLVELARSFDGRGFSLKELLVHLQGLTVKEVREAEAQVEDVGEERVQLMTVHKAKGLEFPICFVADFDTKGRSDTGTFNFSNNWGIGFKGDFLHLKNKEQDQHARREETKRLLYVAATRAKEYLFFSSAPSQNQKDSFLTKLFDYLGCASDDVGIYRGVQVGKIKEVTKKRQGLFSLMDDADFLKALSDRKAVVSEEEETPDVSEWEEIYQTVSQWKFPTFEVIDRSVSALLDFPEIKPSETSPEEFGEEEEVSLAAADYGTLFHSLLETWNVDCKSREEYERVVESLSQPIPKVSRERLKRELHLFFMSDLLNDLKSARTIERELEFDWQIKDARRVRGVIDLLYQSSNGTWCLVDYKTNKVDSDTDVESKMDLYRLQLEVYGASVMKALNLKQLTCGLYFSGLGRTVSWELSSNDLPSINKQIVKKLQATNS